MARRRYNPLQPRGRNGKWVKSGSGKKLSAARKMRVKKDVKVTKFKSNFQEKAKSGALAGGSRSRAAASKGSGAYGAAVVPYARASLRSKTVGVNSGMNVSAKRRLSAGFYIRVENRDAGAVEKALKNANNVAIKKATKALSPFQVAEPMVEAGLKIGRRKLMNKYLGGQAPIAGGKATVRLASSQHGMPSVIIQKGASKVSKDARSKAIRDYDAAIKRSNAQKAKAKKKRPAKRRPERRNAA